MARSNEVIERLMKLLGPGYEEKMEEEECSGCRMVKMRYDINKISILSLIGSQTIIRLYSKEYERERPPIDEESMRSRVDPSRQTTEAIMQDVRNGRIPLEISHYILITNEEKLTVETREFLETIPAYHEALD